MALNEQQLQIKSDTAAAVRAGISERVAVFTKENYEFLRLIAPDLPEKPTDQQFRAYSAELIEKRSINGVSISELDQRLKENENGRAFLASRGASNLSQLIPSNEQITAIANEAGEAVAGNTPTSWIGKRWEGFKGGFSAKGAVENIANRSAAEVTARLNNLASSRPDIGRIMDGQAIADLSASVRKGVVDAAIKNGTIEGTVQPKRDLVAEAKIKPLDAATQDAVFSGFGSMVYDKTKTTINDRIKAAREDGFKGFMMRLLDVPIIGDIIKFFAGLLGFNIPKIPSQDEINNVSSVVAQSTTDVVRENASRLSRTELVEVVRSTTMANLQANRAGYTAFTDEQLIEMANSAAQGVNENYERIPRIAPNDAVRGQAMAAAEPGRGMTQGGNQADEIKSQPGSKIGGQRKI
jgi:hypothetical protein